MNSPFLTAQEAAAALGVKLPTLYAYVSRGLIRSEATGNLKRERLYSAEDVQRLKEHQERRRDPTSAVAGALHWGAPVLESGLTLISDGKLYYRGYDAAMLATQYTLEEVAGLLWEDDLRAAINTLHKPISKTSQSQFERILSQVQSFPLIEAFQLAF